VCVCDSGVLDIKGVVGRPCYHMMLEVIFLVWFVRGCMQSARLTTVTRSAMFEGKFCATAVLNILSNKWTCLPS